MEIIAIDVTAFMQVIDMAFRAAFLTAIVVGFLIVIGAGGAFLVSLLENQDD